MTKTRASITPLVSTAIVIVVTNVLLVFGIVVYQRGKAQAMQRYAVEQATLADDADLAGIGALVSGQHADAKDEGKDAADDKNDTRKRESYT